MSDRVPKLKAVHDTVVITVTVISGEGTLGDRSWGPAGRGAQGGAAGRVSVRRGLGTKEQALPPAHASTQSSKLGGPNRSPPPPGRSWSRKAGGKVASTNVAWPFCGCSGGPPRPTESKAVDPVSGLARAGACHAASRAKWRVLFASLCFLHVEALTAIHNDHFPPGATGPGACSYTGEAGGVLSSRVGGSSGN